MKQSSIQLILDDGDDASAISNSLEHMFVHRGFDPVLKLWLLCLYKFSCSWTFCMAITRSQTRPCSSLATILLVYVSAVLMQWKTSHGSVPCCIFFHVSVYDMETSKTDALGVAIGSLYHMLHRGRGVMPYHSFVRIFWVFCFPCTNSGDSVPIWYKNWDEDVPL